MTAEEIFAEIERIEAEQRAVASADTVEYYEAQAATHDRLNELWHQLGRAAERGSKKVPRWALHAAFTAAFYQADSARQYRTWAKQAAK